MCNFFSFCGDGHGNYLYADWAERKRLNFQDCDSHTAILTRAGIKPEKQNRYSLYEYNPLTEDFQVDKAEDHDVEAARNWVNSRDWKGIVEPLVIKPIVRPFLLKSPRITEKHKQLLRKWASVGVSVWASVGVSVWASVRVSVGVSVGVSVWDSVRDSVWDSVRDSVWAYISSFFSIKYKYDFSPAKALWESGLVASFDGKTWRLHGGKKAKILHEWTPKRGGKV